MAKAPKKPVPMQNAAGSQSRKIAGKLTIGGVGYGALSMIGSAVMGYGAGSGKIGTTVGGYAGSSAAERMSTKRFKQARDGRNRAAALDYAASRAKGGGSKAVDLIRGPVQVTRGRKTFTQMRLIKPK